MYKTIGVQEVDHKAKADEDKSTLDDGNTETLSLSQDIISKCDEAPKSLYIRIRICNITEPVSLDSPPAPASHQRILLYRRAPEKLEDSSMRGLPRRVAQLVPKARERL
jgi:hypothetical protein